MTARIKRLSTPVETETEEIADLIEAVSEGELSGWENWEHSMRGALADQRSSKVDQADWSGQPAAVVPSPVYCVYEVVARGMRVLGVLETGPFTIERVL